MADKIIRGKKYKLDGYFSSMTGAKERAKSLEGRLHIFTGAITRTAISEIPKKSLYAVWVRKERGL